MAMNETLQGASLTMPDLSRWCSRQILGIEGLYCGRGRLLSTTALIARRTGVVMTLAVMLAAGLWPLNAAANPKGGKVVGGSATITQTSPNRVDIRQTSDRAIINWKSFSIDQAERTNFAQPSASSVALNRVVGGDLSRIAGHLSANGNLVLINPNGVVFTSTARVDVNGLIASTSDMSDTDFMAGRLNFAAPSDPSSFIINQGQITAAEGGLVALVAPWVENSGTIAARLGRVELASGGAFTVDLYGDKLIQLAVAETDEGAVPAALSSAARVSNSGVLSADGGVVAISVNDAQSLVANVINMDGIVEARTVEQTAGRIVLNGGGSGIVNVAGTLDASGGDAGETGGQVAVLGEKVGLFDGAVIDVSGDAGGGEALVGGNYQGSGPEPNAQYAYVAKDARIDADALSQGDGGRVIVWADKDTKFQGSISARGGANGGDGGFVEVSGKQKLAFQGGVDLSAAQGEQGTLLLDPNNITIAFSEGINTNIEGNGNEVDPFTTTDDDAVLSVELLENTLTAANVVVQTGTAGTNAQDGDIVILASIAGTSGTNDLTLIAHDDIIFGEGGRIDFSGTEASVSLQADGISSDGVGAIVNNSGSSDPVIVMGSGEFLELSAGSGIGSAINPITLDGSFDVNVAAVTDSGGIFLEAANDVVVSSTGFVDGLSAGGEISVVSLGGNVVVSHAINAGGDVTLGSDLGDVFVDELVTSESGSIFIDSGEDITIAANLSAAGEIILDPLAGRVFIEGSSIDIFAGNGFTVNSDAVVTADLSITTNGGDIIFNGLVDGGGGEPEAINPDLVLASGSGLVRFNDFVGSNIALGDVDATGSSSLSVVDSFGEVLSLIEDFDRVSDDPLPFSFNVSSLSPEFEPATDPGPGTPTPPTPSVDVPNQTVPPSDVQRRDSPARTVDASPVAQSETLLLSLQSLSEIAPGAGTETAGEGSVLISETDSEAISEMLEVIIEACPDVVLTSLSWQNTPADAAFSRDPTISPYSVDEYCGGYLMTYPGRGSAGAYAGLSFVTRDFWTDLDQSRDTEVLPEMLPSFGLPKDEPQ